MQLVTTKVFAEVEIVIEEMEKDFRAGIHEIVTFNCTKKLRSQSDDIFMHNWKLILMMEKRCLDYLGGTWKFCNKKI